MRLDELGPRVCIMGPSNSGKSTLARAVGAARALGVVHLDLLYHRPGTDWMPRPAGEFAALHDLAIAGDRWVLDGNYSRCLPQRLKRATGLILLDVGTATSLLRYLRRTLFEGRTRAGSLPGARESLTWDMIRHIAVATRANRRRYRTEFDALSLPKVALRSVREIDGFFRAERLDGAVRRSRGPAAIASDARLG